MNLAQLTDMHTRNLRRTIEDAERALTVIDSAAQKTAEVLAIASEVGVDTVGIGVKHAALDNEGFPFSPSGSIFTPKENRMDGWPSAWHIAEKAGISEGGGNSGQHQIRHDSCIDGVYKCRNGVWLKIDEV